MLWNCGDTSGVSFPSCRVKNESCCLQCGHGMAKSKASRNNVLCQSCIFLKSLSHWGVGKCPTKPIKQPQLGGYTFWKYPKAKEMQPKDDASPIAQLEHAILVFNCACYTTHCLTFWQQKVVWPPYFWKENQQERHIVWYRQHKTHKTLKHSIIFGTKFMRRKFCGAFHPSLTVVEPQKKHVKLFIHVYIYMSERFTKEPGKDNHWWWCHYLGASCLQNFFSTTNDVFNHQSHQYICTWSHRILRVTHLTFDLRNSAHLCFLNGKKSKGQMSTNNQVVQTKNKTKERCYFTMEQHLFIFI